MAVSAPAWVTERVHGGPDGLGPVRHDFSTNSNACGPCPQAVLEISQCDPASYPDASYSRLREKLAAFHQVSPARVVLAASASEFVFRISAWVARSDKPTVWMPQYSFGDYSHAAAAWGLRPCPDPRAAGLIWRCDPTSPLGQDEEPPFALTPNPPNPPNSAITVLDCAYSPLRLAGRSPPTVAELENVWQLWTPNKALGLTGIRAAYVIAPKESDAACAALSRLCPSWPIGAHGVALLNAWVKPQVQAWLQQSLLTLTKWKARQVAGLQALGWVCLPSVTNFFCAQPRMLGSALDTPEGILAWNTVLGALRKDGIKLRDTASFGLSGHVRLSVLPPASQAALQQAWTLAVEPLTREAV